MAKKLPPPPFLVQKTKPPIIALGILAIMALFHYLLPINNIPFSSKPLGITITVLGVLLILWAAGLFRKKETEILPLGTPSALITSGPYRFTRNPMYLGMVLILFGAACYSGALLSLLGPAFFIATMNATFIPYEEKKMNVLFGVKYEEYKKCVRRWL